MRVIRRLGDKIDTCVVEKKLENPNATKLEAAKKQHAEELAKIVEDEQRDNDGCSDLIFF